VPLFTDRIEEARPAYEALEQRVTAAEALRDQLQSHLDDLRGRLPVLQAQGDQLRQSAIDQAGVNAQLSSNQVVAVSPDMTLGEFIDQLGLAAALGEATMPDRAIPSLTCSLQTYLAVGSSPAAGPRFALRFHHPELGAGAGLSTTTFEISRTPPPAGVSSAPNLYSVLLDMQALYTDPAWAGLGPASQIVSTASQLIAAPQSWSISSLAAAAGQIAEQAQALTALIQPRAPATAAALGAAAAALNGLAGDLAAKAAPVAGDLLELTARLYLITKAARSFVSS
jgi:hypothetical protein